MMRVGVGVVLVWWLLVVLVAWWLLSVVGMVLVVVMKLLPVLVRDLVPLDRLTRLHSSPLPLFIGILVNDW